jgi:hypothetical protein
VATSKAKVRPFAVEPDASGGPETKYSRAFETLVEDPNDLVGLVAYALYKQTVREAAATGRLTVQPRHRFPTPTERSAYRGNAERRLQSFAAVATQQATPEIMAKGIGSAVEAAKVELLQALERRTSFVNAILSNLVAWIITLAVTVLLIVTIYLPNWQADLLERIKAAQTPSAISTPPASAK